ncbi:DUF402 domain-containing protein [Viridibacillus sp. YIM B01967]|uniref:DUF402 domain-containing protein n=1 Tax=Viridibacillus soli TaxID=2798301 RepID=A0ABS1HB05_9BACL|nr:DUF402 domain-containing protein [Viridibacillus soli]MBK3496476.1 DUF402 domain-containing protein [Viridibacillus soli]
MIKRRYGDRSDWGRVLQRKYAQSYIDSKEFKGYLSLLSVEKVSDPLWITYNEQRICIVDDGYMWLQQFPQNKNHTVTTMFDSEGNIVQWYIDVCLECGIEKGIPWVDDLFLDIVLLPSGEIIHKDIDEIEEALTDGTINQEMYDLAWKEFNHVTELIKKGDFKLIQLSIEHKENLKSSLV